MKKCVFACLAALACVVVACQKDDPEEEIVDPTNKEQQMVKAEMTWRLDSVLVINNYKTAAETSYVVYPGSPEFPGWSYTFYPCTYKFPADLSFVNGFSGEPFQLAQEYAQDFCKYICTSGGNIVAAGYLCYYREFFTFNGFQNNGGMQFMLREASTNWDAEVWTCAYNPIEEYDGTVTERNVEFYSRVK